MKIGVILSAYNSENYIDECLTPWFNLKESYDITIGCNSGMFKEYADFGFTPKNKPTLHKLVNYDLDFLISTGPNSLIDETSSRNTILHTLKNTCDIIWILDSDEFYSEKEIINIINYVDSTPEYDWYSVNFKNHVFTKNLFIDGFNPPRIFRTDRYGGINEFYFDNHITYNDGDDFENKNRNMIPRNVAWVKHMTWLNEDSRSKEKIDYQNQRFLNGCSYEWDYEKNSLKFSDEFYKKINLEKPILHEKIDHFSNEFTIDFSRDKNTFYINNVIKRQNLFFKIYDGTNGDKIYETEMNINPNVNYYIYPSSIKFFDLDYFTKFRIEVLENNKIIHNEFIHIKNG